jgi:hypothetical protein
MLQLPASGLQLILTELVAAGAYLDAVKVRLFTNNFAPGESTLLSDFIEATFTDYAAIGPVVWGDPWVDSGGNVIVTGQLCQWVVVTPTVVNTVYGYYATIGAGAGTAWRFAELFPEPKVMAYVGQAVTFAPQFSMPPSVGALE